jgi:hypothetical protein
MLFILLLLLLLLLSCVVAVVVAVAAVVVAVGVAVVVFPADCFIIPAKFQSYSRCMYSTAITAFCEEETKKQGVVT